MLNKTTFNTATSAKDLCKALVDLGINPQTIQNAITHGELGPEVLHQHDENSAQITAINTILGWALKSLSKEDKTALLSSIQVEEVNETSDPQVQTLFQRIVEDFTKVEQALNRYWPDSANKPFGALRESITEALYEYRDGSANVQSLNSIVLQLNTLKNKAWDGALFKTRHAATLRFTFEPTKGDATLNAWVEQMTEKTRQLQNDIHTLSQTGAKISGLGIRIMNLLDTLWSNPPAKTESVYEEIYQGYQIALSAQS